MRISIAFIAGTLIGASVLYASVAGGHSRPPDVAPSAWIPITATSGFVVTNEGRPAGSAVTGYFMAKRADAWVRLNATNQVQVFD